MTAFGVSGSSNRLPYFATICRLGHPRLVIMDFQLLAHFGGPRNVECLIKISRFQIYMTLRIPGCRTVGIKIA